MPSVTIAGYKGVAPNEGTSVLGASSVGTLTFWMATLNLLSHYFGGAACPPFPDSRLPGVARHALVRLGIGAEGRRGGGAWSRGGKAPRPTTTTAPNLTGPRACAALVLNMHYVVGQSGWALGSLVALLVILLLRDCGQRLIGCCEEMQRRGFGSPTYAMIGYEAFGEAGRWLVLVLSLVELWCGVVWMNIVSWNNCTLMLAGYPLHWLIFGFLLLASATCWMRTLQKAGRMSILAALALCVAVGSVVAQLRLLPRLSKEHDREYSPARWEGVGISAAIVAAAFTGHVALPSFYCAMEVRLFPTLPRPPPPPPPPTPTSTSRLPALSNPRCVEALPHSCTRTPWCIVRPPEAPPTHPIIPPITTTITTAADAAAIPTHEPNTRTRPRAAHPLPLPWRHRSQAPETPLRPHAPETPSLSCAAARLAAACADVGLRAAGDCVCDGGCGGLYALRCAQPGAAAHGHGPLRRAARLALYARAAQHHAGGAHDEGAWYGVTPS